MEKLKEIFGSDTLSFEQFEAKISENKMKLADLSGGGYVGKEKFDALNAEKDSLQKLLDEANSKLEGYDPQWKEKAENAQKEAMIEVESLKKSYLVKEQTSELSFSSESAKKAFLYDLVAKDLPVQDGKILGFEDFVKAYKESDPNAFMPDKPAPHFAAPGLGNTPHSKERNVLDNKYRNNPFYKKKGE